MPRYRDRAWGYIVVCMIAWGIKAPHVQADDWPQWLGPKRDGVWRETGILEKFPAGGPKVRWRYPVGEGYSGPAVADGKVFITDRVLAKGASSPADPFDKKRTNGKERILCLRETDGTFVWQYEYECPYQVSYPAGPRTTPAVTKDKVYALGAMGDLVCLDRKTGAKVWHKKLADEYHMEVPMWGFAGHPLIDGDRLICLVGGAGSVVVAFDKDTGKELWKALSAKEPGYAPPMIYEFGGKRQLILWHPQAVNSLNPETGAVYWSAPYGGLTSKTGVKAGMTIPSPRKAGDYLFLTNFYDGSLMLKTSGTNPPAVAWRSMGRSEQPHDTESLHAVMNTPIIKDGYIYGVCSYGELRCLKADTGARIWATHEYTTKKSVRWGNAFLVEQADRCILFNEGGELIIAKFTPKGHEEISRAKILEPTNTMAGRRVVWSHPAFANRSVYARNDLEIICVSLAK
ncbi:MAG TPA: PQQ-binding-like beta-propeller repeat protein [Gemmataceae bacterium]|nr:PQQ-binding-like beta-propeller repeat protein [Gemmataceae bacterium]